MTEVATAYLQGSSNKLICTLRSSYRKRRFSFPTLANGGTQQATVRLNKFDVENSTQKIPHRIFDTESITDNLGLDKVPLCPAAPY